MKSTFYYTVFDDVMPSTMRAKASFWGICFEMGVPVGIIGTMMMAARFVDAFTDVAMGQIVDRSRPGKKGKFIEWILWMCGPVSVASFLMYASWFRDMSLGFKIFWMFLTYLLWGSVFYTSINIPYGYIIIIMCYYISKFILSLL